MQIKNIKYYKNYIFMLIAIVLVPITIAETEDNSVNEETTKNFTKLDLKERKQIQLEKREEIQARKKLTFENKCKNLIDKVEEKVERYNENREEYVDKYQKLSDRILNWVERVKTDGYDTSQLEADLKILEEKISNVADLNTEFLASLESIKEVDCTDTKGAFMTAFDESRVALMNLRAGVMEVRKYFIETIKPDIKEIRAQIKEDNAEESTESNE